MGGLTPAVLRCVQLSPAFCVKNIRLQTFIWGKVSARLTATASKLPFYSSLLFVPKDPVYLENLLISSVSLEIGPRSARNQRAHFRGTPLYLSPELIEGLDS